MIGLVLAAGAGRRLRPFTDSLPKALIPVRGTASILDITLSNFAQVGLVDVAIVVGYRADVIRARRRELEQRHGVNLELVMNDRAEEWNNAYSLWCARGLFSQGFLLANGDTVHPVSVPQGLLDQRGEGLLLAVDMVKALGEEEMKIQLGVDGAVTSITKLMDPDTAVAEYIGLTWSGAGIADGLADALETTFRRDPGQYYEDGYQELVDRGVRVEVATIGDVPWVEVDNLEDLDRAREIACRY